MAESLSLSTISSKFTENTLHEIAIASGCTKTIKWSFGSGFRKGDSYLSELYRLVINCEKKNG